MADDKRSLYTKYRPKKLSEVIGQDQAVAVLTEFLKKKRVPQAILFRGPPGCGKTTLARILAKRLGCSPTGVNFREQNAADMRGIDAVRDIGATYRLSPFGGESCRTYLIDEAQGLTKDAQQAFLKMLEDPPPHVHFLLCSTDPDKLLPTVRSRCTDIVVEPVRHDDLFELLQRVVGAENGDVHRDVFEKIIEVADGSPRRALVQLQKVIDLPKDKQLDAIEDPAIKRDAFQLVKILMGWARGKPNWSEIAAIAQTIPEDDVERFRKAVLSCALGQMIGSEKKPTPPKEPSPRAAILIQAFENNFFDSGKAGLVLACYTALTNMPSGGRR